MALESFSGIWSLNTSNPAAADDVGEGDDHLRGIKASLRQTFPNVSATINVSASEINHLSGVASNIQNALDTTSASLATLTSNVDTISLSLQAEIARTDVLSASLQAEIARTDTLSQSLQQAISQTIIAYGGLAIATGGTIFSASATAQAFTGWDAGMPTSGMTVTTAAGSMSPASTGIYSTAFSFSFSGEASTQFDAILYQDNAATNIRFSRLLGASGDIGAAGASGLVSANASSVFAIRIVGTAGGDDFTPLHGQWHMNRISSPDA